nr:TonB family protein [Pectobacterium colocasium]
MPSSVGMPGSATTAKAGESDSGQAARGAGKSNSQNFKALHRRVNYPARAKALGVEGKVRVKFDITGSGTVTNVQILSETPDGVFGDDVMKDMARWRYRTEAPVENQVVSIVFKLNGHIQVDD